MMYIMRIRSNEWTLCQYRLGKIVIGCLPRVLEVPRVMDDTEVPRILWVKCATSAECKTIRIAVSMVKDSWAVLLKLCPEFANQCVCLDNYLGQVKDLT